MVRLFAPGIRLLNGLRYPQKFLLVSMLLVLPLLLAIGLLLSETLPRIAFTQRELAGSQYIERLRLLINMIEESSQLVSGAQFDQASAGQAEIRASLMAVINDAQLENLFATHQLLRPLEQQQQLLQEAVQHRDRKAIDDSTTALLAALRDEIRRIGDSSNLILDPELTTYYLMNTAVVQAPAQALLLQKVHMAVDGSSANPDQYQLSVLTGQIEENVDTTRQGIHVALKSDPQLDASITAALADSLTSATALTEALRATGQTGRVESERALLLNSDAFQANMRLWNSVLNALDSRLQQRINLLSQKNILAAGAAMALLICVIYLLTAFYRAIMQMVAALDQASQRLLVRAQGIEVQITTRDELGQIVTAFNRVAGALLAESHERQASDALRTQLQEQIIQTQAANLAELAVPVIPLSKHVLLLPLIGKIDPGRAQQILETALHGVADHQAELLILDMSGVWFVDQHVAEAILNTIQGAQLLGARVVLAGVRAEVASTIAHLTVNLRAVTFYATLQSALDAHTLTLAQNAV